MIIIKTPFSKLPRVHTVMVRDENSRTVQVLEIKNLTILKSSKISAYWNK